MEEILKRLSRLKDNNSSKLKYDEMLLDLIPYLKYFQYIEGGEGKAYFVGDNYVVKKYSTLADASMFGKYFESYCREIQNFSKSELMVPNIYSWNSIPQVVVEKNVPKVQYVYYILEERIKGRPIFSGSIEDVFHLCSDICDRKKFNSVVKNPYTDQILFNEITKRYIDDYILMNTSIESLNESDIERFVMSVYKMYEEGENSSPDMYPLNVILTPNNKLFAIDNNLISKKEDSYYTSSPSEVFTLTGILCLFMYNEQISNSKYYPYFMLENPMFGLSDRIEKNKKVCDAAIKKVMKVTKNCIDKPFVINKTILNRLHKMLKNILGNESANEVLNQFQK